MIVTFTNNKGGIGKTSLAVLLAESAIERGFPVSLYDLDKEQRNLTLLISAWDKEIAVDGELPAKLPNDCLVIIDTPPALGEQTERAIKAADVVVVPVDTSITSITAVQKISAINPRSRVIVAVNKYEQGSGYDRNVVEMYRKKINTTIITVPRNRYIIVNLSQGYTWNYRMTETGQKAFLPLINAISNNGRWQ